MGETRERRTRHRAQRGVGGKRGTEAGGGVEGRNKECSRTKETRKCDFSPPYEGGYDFTGKHVHERTDTNSTTTTTTKRDKFANISTKQSINISSRPSRKQEAVKARSLPLAESRGESVETKTVARRAPWRGRSVARGTWYISHTHARTRFSPAHAREAPPPGPPARALSLPHPHIAGIRPLPTLTAVSMETQLTV